MNTKGTCVIAQCNGFVFSTRPSDKRNSKSNSDKSCFILTSESALWLCVSQSPAHCSALDPRPEFVFYNPGAQFVFTSSGPQFVFTGPVPQVYYQPGAWLWPTICIIGLRPEFVFTLLLVVVAVVLVIVVVVISLD